MSLTKVQPAMIGSSTSTTAFAAGTPIYENTNIVNSTYTITAGSNALSVGPITIAAGTNITIPAGSRWLIL